MEMRVDVATHSAIRPESLFSLAASATLITDCREGHAEDAGQFYYRRYWKRKHDEQGDYRHDDQLHQGCKKDFRVCEVVGETAFSQLCSHDYHGNRYAYVCQGGYDVEGVLRQFDAGKEHDDGNYCGDCQNVDEGKNGLPECDFSVKFLKAEVKLHDGHDVEIEIEGDVLNNHVVKNCVAKNRLSYWKAHES